MRRLNGLNVGITLTVVAALGSLFFTVAASTFVYRNTKDLIVAEGWVEHSQEVLTGLQSAAQRLDRIEAQSQLFLATNDQDHLTIAKSNAISLGTASTHIRSLVYDNPEEIGEVTALSTCTRSLTSHLEQVQTTGKLPEPDLLRCRQILGHMSELERRLLKQRAEASRERSQRSVMSEFGLGGISLFVLITLFGLLVRDAVRRMRMERKTGQINLELATTVTELKNRAEESQRLTIARDELQLCTTLDQVYRAATTSFGLLAPSSRGSLCMINNSRHLVEVVARWGSEGATSDLFVPQSCCALRSGRLRWRQVGESEVDCTHFVGGAPNAYCCLPLVAQGETLGVLFLAPLHNDDAGSLRAFEDSIRQLAELTAMTIAGLQLRNKLETQSVRDGLTGLFNRHFMEIAFDRELARAERAKYSVAALMLDVDHFKIFNDQYGHATGDLVLKEVAQAFESKTRSGDLVCRYGGEEFAIILPDITLEGAFHTAERIRTAVAALHITSGLATHSNLSISIGLAMFPQDAGTSAELLRKADAALYRAKHEGRNQVMLALSTN